MPLRSSVVNTFDQNAIFKAEIIETLDSYDDWDQIKIANYYQKLNDKNKPNFAVDYRHENKFLYLKAPTKSCIVNVFYKDVEYYIVAYPFFSSHISLPLKAGEHAWCFIHEDKGLLNAYWITRIHASEIAEDVNISDLNREYSENGFIDETVSESIIEPVPRSKISSSDLVIQGSNNSAIQLGNNLHSKFDKDKEKDKYVRGSIDIVVGKGRFKNFVKKNGIIRFENFNNKNMGNTSPLLTSHYGYFESDKDPIGIGKPEQPDKAKNNKDVNPSEGEIDLRRDAARIALNLRSDPDDDFDLVKYYPEVPNADDKSNVGKTIDASKDTASIVVKSDEIRIIARNIKDEDINGSIKIIKEGTNGVDDRAIILMQPDGTIMIDSPKIVIGSNRLTSNGEGNQISFGLSAKEPLVLGDTLKQKLEAFMDAVVDAFDYAANHVHPTGTGPSGPPTGQLWSSKSSNIKKTKSELKDILSKIGKTN
jgi:hypothetical protein